MSGNRIYTEWHVDGVVEERIRFALTGCSFSDFLIRSMYNFLPRIENLNDGHDK